MGCPSYGDLNIPLIMAGFSAEIPAHCIAGLVSSGKALTAATFVLIWRTTIIVWGFDYKFTNYI